MAPSILLLHTRADIYPDPFAFRPERFLEQPAGTYTWIPFGGGVRRCLGASFAIFEMKAVLRAIAASDRAAGARPRGRGAGDPPRGDAGAGARGARDRVARARGGRLWRGLAASGCKPLNGNGAGEGSERKLR